MMSRYWIDQPSKHQICHRYHGMLVLAPRDLPPSHVTVYPVSGETISMLIPTNALSSGWPAHLQR